MLCTVHTNRTNGPRGLASYEYDAEKRRSFKSSSPGGTRYFTYSGWSLLCETLTTDHFPLTTYFVWGRDLSGTLDGAGGVGGLLATEVGGVWYFPLYDNNGNVTDYVSETGEVVASYAYDAFGRTIDKSGPMADVFPFRFSTKYYDAETGLYYYGYRYYSPELGRWLTRDPIEEDGGDNLYAFCGNNGLNRFDILGAKAYYADYSRHQLGAEDQNMRQITDVNVVKAMVANLNRECGNLEDGPMQTENVSLMRGTEGGKPYRTLLQAMLKDKDQHPQFYGHGTSDRIVMAQTGPNQNLELVLTADTLIKAKNKSNNLDLIAWTDFAFFSCRGAAESKYGPNFCQAFSSLTGKPVSGNEGYNTLDIAVWLFCPNGEVCNDQAILKEFKQITSKLTRSEVFCGASSYSVELFKLDWSNLFNKYKAMGKIDKAFWDVYQKEFDSRKTIGGK